MVLFFFFQSLYYCIETIMLSAVTDGEDENGLKLEKISEFFQVLKLYLVKIRKKIIMVYSPSLILFGIFAILH